MHVCKHQGLVWRHGEQARPRGRASSVEEQDARQASHANSWSWFGLLSYNPHAFLPDISNFIVHFKQQFPTNPAKKAGLFSRTPVVNSTRCLTGAHVSAVVRNKSFVSTVCVLPRPRSFAISVSQALTKRFQYSSNVKITVVSPATSNKYSRNYVGVRPQRHST